MSGGSMDYLYSKIEEQCKFALTTPLRRAFKEHMAKVVLALHDIEWVDSGDTMQGDENEAIRTCIGNDELLAALITEAKSVRYELAITIVKIEKEKKHD